MCSDQRRPASSPAEGGTLPLVGDTPSSIVNPTVPLCTISPNQPGNCTCGTPPPAAYRTRRPPARPAFCVRFNFKGTLQTSNVDNMYVNTHFVCKSVAMITCMLYSDAALQSHCISPFSHCNVAARYNVAMRTRVAVLYRPSCVTKTLYACHYQCIKCIASKLSTQIYHLCD